MSYILRVKVIDVVNEPNDVAVQLQSHLTDTAGVPFLNSSGRLDEFIIRAPKSSIPGTGIIAYLNALALEQIAIKYDAELTAIGEDGSDVLSMSTSDVDSVFTDLLVDGPGLSSPSALISITSPTQILLADPLTLEYTADTTNPEFTKTGDLTLDDNIITSMSNVTDIEVGMSISGAGIPVFATVSSILSSSSIAMTQNAVASGTGVSLTFSSHPDSSLLKSVSPAILSERYVGMGISGPGIPEDTTIAEVNSSSELLLSTSATATNIGATYTVTGEASYFFDTSALTIDLSDLVRVDSIIDFSAL